MNIRNAYVDVADGQVHYRAAGEAGPALILFHQTPLSSRMYEHALPYLGRHCRAFAFDTPGYGASSPPEEEATIGGYANTLIAAVSSLGIEKFAVCGFSTGSVIAVEVAGQAKDRVTHIILSGTPVLSDERMKAFAAVLGPKEIARDGKHFGDMWNSRLTNYGDGGGIDQIQMAASEALRSFERLDWGLTAVSKFDIAAALSKIEVPALFLTGEHDKLAPENRKAAALVKGAREVDYPGGHPQLSWTAPEWFSDQVRDFISRD
jgi:pimeloyl-ACP methyl ester carboxylesterase